MAVQLLVPEEIKVLLNVSSYSLNQVTVSVSETPQNKGGWPVV